MQKILSLYAALQQLTMITRALITPLQTQLKAQKKKVLILIGSRQTGKTTLLHTLFPDTTTTLFWNGDDPDIAPLLINSTATRLKALLGTHQTLIIDEAQRIDDIGLILKRIYDQIPTVQLVVSGSSALDLRNKLNEPLTGRKWEYTLYPISFSEMVQHHGLLEEKRMLHHRLVYGYYPEVVTNPGAEKELLKQLSDSFLYKDILLWDGIKKPEKLVLLMKAIAYQLGNQVSYNELGQLTGLDNETVEHYIQLLEKTFVIFRLPAYTTNQRNELKKTRKIYFYDNGIRNALINQFGQVETRHDIGALWENFLMAERQKYIAYNGLWRSSFFWRNVYQNEVDYVETFDNELLAYEFKWNEKAKAKLPSSFANLYPHALFMVVTPQNMEEFIL